MTMSVNLINFFSPGHQSQPCGKCDYTSPCEVQLGDIFAMRKSVLSLKPMSSANTPTTLTHVMSEANRKKEVIFVPIVKLRGSQMLMNQGCVMWVTACVVDF